MIAICVALRVLAAAAAMEALPSPAYVANTARVTPALRAGTTACTSPIIPTPIAPPAAAFPVQAPFTTAAKALGMAEKFITSTMPA